MLEANLAAFTAGVNFGETAELFDHAYEVKPAQLPAGTYRNITGNVALSYGLGRGRAEGEAAAVLRVVPDHARFRHPARALEAQALRRAHPAGRRRDRGGRRGRRCRVRRVSLAVTGTSGPGLDLKSEALGLALSLELPLLLVDVQRGGPSTGLPTKTEQADLMLAMYGRHGEAPLPIVAAKSPSDCFDAAFEAVRIAVKYRTPVILLTDGYLANGAEPWKLPDTEALPDISTPFATEPNHGDLFWPYLRDPETLARPWAIPGTPGLMHRVGGLEKEDGSGNVSYEPENHEKMTRLRAAKIAGIAKDIPGVELDHEEGATFLLCSWGGTWGVATAAVRRIRARGIPIAHAHLTHLSPFPADLGDVLARYDQVLVPELNLGQLSKLLRAEYLVDAQSFTKVQGSPFKAAEVESKILELMNA